MTKKNPSSRMKLCISPTNSIIPSMTSNEATISGSCCTAMARNPSARTSEYMTTSEWVISVRLVYTKKVPLQNTFSVMSSKSLV